MEIQYTQFNKWNKEVNTLNSLVSHDLFRSDKLISFVNGTDTMLSKVEADSINETRKVILEWKGRCDKIFPNVIQEIELNVVSIENEKVLEKYLKYILKKNAESRSMLNAAVNHKELAGAVTSEDIPGSEIFVNGIVKGRRILEKTDPISMLLSQSNSFFSLERLIHKVENLLYRDRRISKEALVLEHELTANTHKLLLFHELGMLEPLYTKYRGHIGVVRFAKLIGTLLGVPEEKNESFRKSLDDFITETFLKVDKKKTVATPAAQRKVNAFLVEIGLTNIE